MRAIQSAAKMFTLLTVLMGSPRGVAQAADSIPMLPVVSNEYAPGAVRSGPFSAKILRTEDGEEQLVASYDNGRTPLDAPELIGLAVNGHWVGEYRGFSSSARGDWYLIEIPLSRDRAKDGLLELYVRKYSGEYDSDFGRNYKFILEGYSSAFNLR